MGTLRPGRSFSDLKNMAVGIAFVSPWLIGFLVFQLMPILTSLVMSFTDWNMFTPPNFVGFSNYSQALSSEPFKASVRVTILFSLMTVPTSILLSIGISILLHSKLPGIYIFRVIYYLPSVTSGVAVALVWKWMYNPEFGLFNYLLSFLGIERISSLNNPYLTLPSVSLMAVWMQVSGSVLIYLAGLNGISRSYYESADIDGANTLHKFFFITLPMLTPTIFFNLIMSVINSFQFFTQAFVMTQGGPGYATYLFVINIYETAFRFFKMGMASALAWYLFAIILVITLVQIRTSKRWVYYEGEQR